MKDKYADLLKLARKRRDDAEVADFRNRERAEHDLRFLTGEGQWEEEVKRERETEGKPCLTINSLPQFVRAVTGQIRQINPAIRVVAGDNDATDDVADIIEGLVRHIENRSEASNVYERAAESAAACSIGWFRVLTEYCDEYSFDQEIKIDRIHNPFSVFVDPLAKHPTRMDARYMFVVEEIDLDDFKDMYPDVSMGDWTPEHRPDDEDHWYRTDVVAVAEYYWIENDKKKISLLRSGEVVEDVVAPMDVVRTREVTIPRVRWAKINGYNVLEGPIDIPSRYIPVIAVTGEEWHVGEEMYRSSIIRYAKDPQLLYNYSRSAHAEMIALQPKAPYIVTARQVENLETFWNEANNSNRPYLPYNPDPQAPPPQRATPPVPSAGLMQEIALAGEDMKRTTGIYDASLGNRSNEVSGIAIRQRQMEAQIGTSIYADNMALAIAHCGRIIVDMIPRVYDTQRAVRILGQDDQEQLQVINAVLQGPNGEAVPINDVTLGKYDVRVSVGPSYDTKRDEAREGLMSFIQAYPPAAQVAGDLIAKAQDWPDAERLADRLRKLVPPGIIGMDELSPEELQQMQAAQAQVMQQQQLQAQVAQARMQTAVTKEQAEAQEAVADAEKARSDAHKAALDVVEQQIQLAIQSGQMDAAINAAVARVVQGIMPVN